MAKLAIEKMSVEGKISAVEELRDDLCHRGKIDSPAWHGEILREREAIGETPMDREAAKEQLLKKFK